jgi:dTDP-4-amino-4,6-dideoxygalactose transaminase
MVNTSHWRGQSHPMITVPFNRATILGTEESFVIEAIRSGRLSGDGAYGRKCEERAREHLGCGNVLLTSSGTHALEMAAILLDLSPGDEVIMPSFTFTSTATAFVLRGARPVFVDVRHDTMNIDEMCIEAAITPRTRAIVVVHYGGVACQMDRVRELASAHGLAVIEDAAHAVGGSWMDRPLGTLGDIGAFSFHETKNLTSGGEGGMIWLRDPELFARAQVIREKGTNRSAFRAGKVNKYEWMDIGSSYLMAELNAAYLWPQLAAINQITLTRRSICDAYRAAFADIIASGRVTVQETPQGTCAPGHLFYLKLRDEGDRDAFIDAARDRGVLAVSHYVPLHTAPAGRKLGRFVGRDVVTTHDSRCLVRLPVFYNMTKAQRDLVIDAALAFFANNR